MPEIFDTEYVDRRVLGALVCIDRATGAQLNRSVRVSSDDLCFIRNRSNLYVIKSAPGLENHVDSFSAAPALPATGSLAFTVDISDPTFEYLPRSVAINLPRDANPGNAANQDSLFNPINVPLYAAPNANVMANWSTVRVSVERDDVELGLVPAPGALLRVIRNSDDAVLSSGISDQRGEALIIVPGVPITLFADDELDDDSDTDDDDLPVTPPIPAPVVVSEIAARLEVSFATETTWPTNPDLLELNHSTNLVATESLTLRTGRMEKVAIQLT
jgi:hypothetical protein